jgi:hypothetical protein
MSDTAVAASKKMPFSLINELRNKVKHTMDENILITFEQWLDVIATSSLCKPCFKKECLSCLFDDDVCEGMEKYLLHWGRKDAHNCKQIITDWYHYAKTSVLSRAQQVYQLPYDAGDLSDLATRKVAIHTLCLSALPSFLTLVKGSGKE